MVQFIKPSSCLTKYIKYFWTVEIGKNGHSELVYPTGEMQLLFHYGEPFVEKHNGIISKVQNNFSICGQKTKYTSVEAKQSSGVVGVVFYPHSASAFFPFSLSEIINDNIAFEDVYLDWKHYEERFYNSTKLLNRVTLIESFLQSKLHIKNMMHFSLVESCSQDILAANGEIHAAEIIDKYDISLRTLQRLFDRYIGISFKRFSDIIKFNRAISLFQKSSSLTETCYEAGYYDQSHFIKSFKQYTGLTPSKFKINF